MQLGPAQISDRGIDAEGAGQGRVVVHDRLIVAGIADIEFDGADAGGHHRVEGGQRVFNDLFAIPLAAMRHDDGAGQLLRRRLVGPQAHKPFAAGKQNMFEPGRQSRS